MSIQNAYNEWSETYDSDENLTRDLDQQVTRSLLGGTHFESILEIGCGTGKNTIFLAQIGQRVRAVDFSQGMIEKAKQKVHAENVSFSMMDITQPWKFENQSFDLILCNLVLEHIENLSAVFHEAARTLRPTGNFFINELHPFRQYDGKKARFIRNEEKIEVDAFIHHLSDFLHAANDNRLALTKLEEYWHEADQNKLPRLLSLVFERR
ncbi:MAG TPA: class I SAM-dependent methyltransferase [Anaerolineales bacterium]|nr:class I SAM-dependent methyltransferase [Anaerolineales bacterium]